MEEQVHKRRVRYKGTHPRKFEEKYKELNPEKYQEDVAKIRQSGKTIAGTHVPIMVNEILDVLQIQPGMQGYDATLGYGGHTTKMLEKLQGQGHLVATDVDPIESAKTVARLRDAGFDESIFSFERKNFAEVDTVNSGASFDFVLADLGVSSMQIDNPSRGFTFKANGPLDLRLDPSSGIPASERLKSLTFEELIDLLVENSDEPYAEEISRSIFRRLSRGVSIETTFDLRDAVTEALSFLPQKEKKEAVKKSCQRVFQALRIDVNSEFEVLFSFLDKIPQRLAPGGRLAILTFHSGEDRMVKKALKQGLAEGLYSEIASDVIRPSSEECFQNPRAKSTKLRWAIRAK